MILYKAMVMFNIYLLYNLKTGNTVALNTSKKNWKSLEKINSMKLLVTIRQGRVLLWEKTMHKFLSDEDGGISFS